MPGLQPPFDAGFEAVGRVASIGDGVTGLKIGDPVVYSAFGAFAEMKEVGAVRPCNGARLLSGLRRWSRGA